MPTMRTIEQAAAHLKEQDKDSCVTKNSIRNWILNNQLRSVRVGNRYLVSLEVLEEFLKGDLMPQAGALGNIRKLNERL